MLHLRLSVYTFYVSHSFAVSYNCLCGKNPSDIQVFQLFHTRMNPNNPLFEGKKLNSFELTSQNAIYLPRTVSFRRNSPSKEKKSKVSIKIQLYFLPVRSSWFSRPIHNFKRILFPS